MKVLVSKSGKPVAILPHTVTCADIHRVVIAYSRRHLEVSVKEVPIVTADEILKFD